MSKALRIWTSKPLSAEVRQALLRLTRIRDVEVVAAMPDVHLATCVCVGVVIATRNSLFPDAVGGDIGCGMSALRFRSGEQGGAKALQSKGIAEKVFAMLGARIPCASHVSARAALPAELAQRPLSAPSLLRKQAAIGRVQFATLGRGNHFVEFQKDSEGELWLMLHSGSRGIGQAIRQHHGGGDGEMRPIAADSEQGLAYLSDLTWALDYAKSSRHRMAEVVAEGMRELIGLAPDWDTYVDCHHNFVRKEQHAGAQLWVHRKGAISARKGEAGIIPGSMGSSSYHVIGRGNPDALCSSSHGAGRVLSRSAARRAISTRALAQQMRGVLFDTRMARRLCDEAPGAYKEIGAVMRAQRELTRIERRLDPVLVYKGG